MAIAGGGLLGGCRDRTWRRAWSMAALVAGAFCFCVPAAAQQGEAGRTEEPVVAWVNGEPITRAQLVEQALEWYGSDTLDEMITRLLLRQKQREWGVTITEEELRQRVAQEVEFRRGQVRTQYGVELEQYLQAYGETVESFRKKVRSDPNFELQLILETMVQYALLNEDKVMVRHLVVDSLEKAQKMRDALKEGADFARMAQQKSLDKLTSRAGGRVAPFLRGLCPYGAEFEQVVFGLEPGQLSEVVQTPAGFHVLKLDKRLPGLGQPYAELRDRVLQELAKQPVDKQMAMQWMSRLRQLHEEDIRIAEDVTK